MKYCPKCNSEYENNIKFCQKCGTELETKINLKTCPSCNAENPESAKFCNECGESFNLVEYKCSKCGKVYEDNKFAFCPNCGGKVEEIVKKSHKEQINELSNKIESIQKELNNSKSKESTLQSKLKDLESEKANLESKIVKIESAKNESQKQSNSIEKQLIEFEKKESNYQKQIKDINSEKDGLKNLVAKMESERNSLKQKLCLTESELSKVKTELQKYEEKLSQNAKENKQKKESCGEFVLVEGGTVDLGSSNKNDGNPIHEVTLDSFYISKYQVTQKLYQSVMGKNPSKFKGDNRPVECVRWYDAVAFCNKLSEMEGLETCYTIDNLKKDPNNKNKYDDVKWTVECDFTKKGYRLPTEAEWEYAARGGQKTESHGYAGFVSWYEKNSNKQTHDVGEKEPNELGLYDMIGNVWEWCWDWYDKIRGGNNPRGPKKGSRRVLRGGSWGYADVGRVLRGGSWSSDGSICAVSYRNGYGPDYCYNGGGFRLVRSSSN